MEKSVVRKLRNVRPKVERLLRDPLKGEIYRDNDEMLAARFWAEELMSQQLNLKRMNAEEFLLKYAKGEVTPIDLILRARRKAQELNEDCRGVRWHERHGMDEDLKKNVDKI